MPTPKLNPADTSSGEPLVGELIVTVATSATALPAQTRTSVEAISENRDRGFIGYRSVKEVELRQKNRWRPRKGQRDAQAWATKKRLPHVAPDRNRCCPLKAPQLHFGCFVIYLKGDYSRYFKLRTMKAKPTTFVKRFFYFARSSTTPTGKLGGGTELFTIQGRRIGSLKLAQARALLTKHPAGSHG